MAAEEEVPRPRQIKYQVGIPKSIIETYYQEEDQDEDQDQVDPRVVAFDDEQITIMHARRGAVAPVHLKVFPKKYILRLSDVKAADIMILGKMIFTAHKVAQEQGLTDGYRLVINHGRFGCESQRYLKFHVIGGKQLQWPPTKR
nr:histidine triad nucleotide-binding protein 1-like [Lytechinus pictus]